MNKYLNPKNYLHKFRNLFNNEVRIFFPWFSLLLKKPQLIKFLVSWRKDLNVKNASAPWLTYEAIGWLDNYLTKDMMVFEWGSGGSTIYIAKKVKKIISVEHDAQWYTKVSGMLKKNDIANCEYILKEPAIAKNKNYRSSDKRYVGFDFEAYCKTINAFPDTMFDVIIIDGRARPSCILHATNKIRAGGCLIIDDSERAEYVPAMHMLTRKWTRKDFFGPKPYTSLFEQTSIFIHETENIRQRGQE